MNAVSGRPSLASQLPQGLLVGMTLVFTADDLTDFRPAIRPPRFVFDLDLSRRKAVRQGRLALGYLALFQVTRCKSGTISRRDRSTGYVHPTRLSNVFQTVRTMSFDGVVAQPIKRACD